MERRRLLAAAGALVASLAGCLGGLDERDRGNGDGNDTDGDGVASDVFRLGAPVAGPRWAERRDGPGFVATIESAGEWPRTVDAPESVDGLEEWVDETDFEASTVVFVGTVAPNTCYGIAVSDVGVEDGTITASVRAVDERDPGEGCGEAVTYPAVLLRVPADDPPARAAIEVTDGWGETDTVTAGDGADE